jgi:hypothetical protein
MKIRTEGRGLESDVCQSNKRPKLEETMRPHLSETEELKLDKNRTKGYIEKNVKAVVLPEKCKDGEGGEDEEEEESTYPALVLDGASGTGKTQQAFALLKNGERVVYLLMADAPLGTNDQKIYKAMREFIDMEDLLQKLKNAVKYCEQEQRKEENKQNDLFSVDYLRDYIKMKHPLAEEIELVIEAIKKNIVKYVGANDILKKERYSDRSLDGVVLFADEALPSNTHNWESKEVGLSALFRKMQDLNISKDNLFFDSDDFDNPYDGDETKKRKAEKRKAKIKYANEMRKLVAEMDEINEKTGVHPKRLLQFTRNFGRALGMRVVMAGTGATVANMVKSHYQRDSDTLTHGRTGEADVGWVECEFMWRKMHVNDFEMLFQNKQSQLDAGENSSTFLEEVKEERPLVAQIIGREWREKKYGLKKGDLTSEESKFLLLCLKDQLQATKPGINFQSMMIWRTGAWLERTLITPSPFRLQPADLVKGHFFEPAVVTVVGEDRPYVGRGLEQILTVSSSLRLFINRAKVDKNVFWSVSLSKNPDKACPKFSDNNSSISESFAGVEYTLSHCVQQCLAREPLLAVALSTIQCDTRPDQLFSGVKEIWKESSVQHSTGSVDGELNELMSFLAIQHACYGDELGSTKPVSAFIENVRAILECKTDGVRGIKAASRILWGEESRIVKTQKSLPRSYWYPISKVDDMVKFLKKKGTVIVEKTLEGLTEDEKKERVFQKYKQYWDKKKIGELVENTEMPWLVPACSYVKLKEKIDKFPTLFKDLNIAGLVPGEEHKAPFDARAFSWKKGAPLEWLFEFKARRGEYGPSAARNDLDKKIKEEGKVACHAMLIAVRGKGDSECYIWNSDKDLEDENDGAAEEEKGKKLRILLLLSV